MKKMLIMVFLIAAALPPFLSRAEQSVVPAVTSKESNHEGLVYIDHFAESHSFPSIKGHET